MTLTVLTLSLLMSPAWAGKDATRTVAELSLEVRVAEHSRLSGEIQSLARRSAWNGVDKAYDRISLLQVEMSWDDHVMGAHASSELGEIAKTRERLHAAVQIQPQKVLVDWLWDLDHSYGMVRLSAPETASLEARSIPIDPVQRKAVDNAISRCAEVGTFDGLLPVGIYAFEGQSLVVEAGVQSDLIIQPEIRSRRFPTYKVRGEGSGL